MSEDKIWYIALNDEQVGPLSEDEVRAEIEAGQVSGSTYIWREGMDDWVMADDAAEFAGLAPAALDSFEEADEPDIADVAGESVDAFFASYDTPGSFDAAADDASADDAEDTGPSGIAATTVASRSDDSVLFSLDELAETTERASTSDDSSTDGSGLIDLSALASTSATLGGAATASSSDDDDRAAAAVSSGPATTTVAPIALAPPKKSVLPMVLLAVAVLAILGLLVAIFLLLGDKDEAPVADAPQQGVAAQEDAAAPGADAKAADADAAAAEEPAADDAEQAAADADAEEPEAPEAPEEPEEPEAAVAAKSPSKSKPSSSSRSSSSSKSKPTPKPAAKPKPSTPKPSKSSGSGGGDSVSAALASLGSDKDKEESSAKSDAPTSLSNSQIRSTVRRYNSKVQRCKKSDADAGTYRVAFAINPNGRTSQVSPRGGGAAGACVADVVKTMRFPAFNGDTRKLTYTFAIR